MSKHKNPDPTRRDWRRAGRALQRLVEDSSRTDEVFEILDGLSGKPEVEFGVRFRSDPAGIRLLNEKPDLRARLCDRAALAALPEGTLGREYADLMEAEGLSADGLVAADVERPDRDPIGMGPDDLYIGERQRDAHDLWHVVTGYGMDEAGEAALLAFSFAQFRNLGMGLIAAAAAVLGPKDLRLTWQRYLVRAWWRGRRAQEFATVAWEDWLVRPLAAVRTDLRVGQPERAHPGGIIVAASGGILNGRRAMAPGA